MFCCHGVHALGVREFHLELDAPRLAHGVQLVHLDAELLGNLTVSCALCRLLTRAPRLQGRTIVLTAHKGPPFKFGRRYRKAPAHR